MYLNPQANKEEKAKQPWIFLDVSNKSGYVGIFLV